MGNAAVIMASLELTRGKFKTEVEQTEAELEKVQGTFKETAAAVAVLEREFKNDSGNKALKDNLGTLKKSLSETEKEMKLLETQKKRLDAALGTTPAPKPAAAPAKPAASEPEEKPLNYDDESYTRFRGRQKAGGEEEGGNARMANAEAGHSVRSILGSMGAGQSVGQSLQMELPRLLQAAGWGIGSMIGIEAATGIISGIQKGIEKARELKKAISEALAGNGGGVGGSSSSALSKQMGDMAEQRDKLLGDGTESLLDKGTNFAKNFFRAATSPTDHQTVESERDQNVETLEGRRIQLSKELADRKEAQVALEERSVAEGETAVAIDKERLDLAERRRGVMDDKNLDEQAKARTLDLLNRESAAREKLIRLSQQQKAVEDEAHHANAEDRRYGVDTEVTKAEHALEEAKKKRDLLPFNSKERNAADDDVTDKEADLRKAKHELEERAAQRRDAGSLAGMTGTDAAKQRQALLDEQERLRAQLRKDSSTYEPNAEKRDDIEKNQLPEVASKLRDQDANDRQREFERRRNEIKAATGVGAQEKLKAIDDTLALNQDQQKDNASHKNDPVVASQLVAEAADLKRQKQEIEIASAHELANAKAQTQEMQLQQIGQVNAAQIVGLRVQYEERIAAALRDGKTELAEQLRLQKSMGVQAAQLADFRKTPQQRAQERLTAQKDEQDLNQLGIKQKQALENRRRNYEEEHRASLPTDAQARAAAIAAAVPDVDSILDRKSENGRAKESAGNASDDAFIRRFHPSDAKPAPQPDRRNVATADPQQQQSHDDSNAGDVVDVLEDIRGILDERLKLEI